MVSSLDKAIEVLSGRIPLKFKKYPSAIKEALKMPDRVYHFVENLAK